MIKLKQNITPVTLAVSLALLSATSVAAEQAPKVKKQS